MAVTPVLNTKNLHFTYADAKLSPAHIILANTLEQLSLDSKTQPLFYFDLGSIEKAYSRETLKDLSDEEVLFRLHLIEEYSFPNARLLVEGIANHFNAKYPSLLDQYFHYNGQVVNTQGSMVILKEIAKKKDTGLVVRPLSEVNAFLNSDEQAGGFLLGLSQLTHYIPLYLQKREDGLVDIIITDSLGTSFLDCVMADLPDTIPLGNIYASGMARQADGVHCSVFAIRDLAKWMDTFDAGINPVEMIEKNSPSLHTRCVNDKAITVFSYLPPEMMRTTQSMRTINTYEQTFEKSVSRHEYHHPRRQEGQMNCLIEERYIKYATILIEKALRERPVVI
ncbi:MAG: hypothetical protein SP1CHLAM54_16070 [Chlamydiia bacterium]|nr:hypothetical protein [Chlamydiia bacterium]MCH9616496.1 hypothetical protein [Chlamydiia bacterium]MCH9629518.1 hypothetical protein [Chlamydiia bacterium]